jgi:probable HAF family extracellular repeat protein
MSWHLVRCLCAVFQGRKLICRQRELAGRLAAFVTVVNICAALYGATPLYQPVNLGSYVVANVPARDWAINNSGQIVGNWFTNPATGNPLVYTNGNASEIDLSQLGAGLWRATDINNTGQVVGYDSISGTSFLWSGGGAAGGLGGLPFAAAISNSGRVSGLENVQVTPNTIRAHAAVWNNGSITDVYALGLAANPGLLTGDFNSYAVGSDNSGQVTFTTGAVGQSLNQYMYVYSSGAVNRLGFSPDGFNVTAYHTSASGQVVGAAPIQVGASALEIHAFAYSSGTMTDLGTLGGNAAGANSSYALGNNNLGQVVGTTTTPTSPGNSIVSHAFIYSQGSMLDLNNLLDSSGANWSLASASGINDNGWIVGDGGGPGGGTAFLLIPVLLGDLDRNGRVDASDIHAMMTALRDLKSYQASWGLSDNELKSIGDFDGDGVVTNTDLQGLINLLANSGGSGSSSLAPVSEPANWVLAAIAFVCCAIGARTRAAPDRHAF